MSGGGKVSPRQKMINMMYLVLIALLAMNVSKEILKAFHLMDVSFEKTGESLATKMTAGVAGIEEEIGKQGPKAQPYYDKAKEAKGYVEELIEVLNKASSEIIANGGGREGDEIAGKKELTKPDDTEKHANYFSSENPGKGNGIKIRNKIEELREKIVGCLKPTGDSAFIIPASYYAEAKSSSDLEIADFKSTDGQKVTWEKMLLVETPLAGAVTTLTRLKNETYNLGNNVIGKLQQSINAKDIKIDKMQAMVNARSSYVMQGTTYEADILLVASSSTANYQVILDGGGAIEMDKGIGKFKTTASGIGPKKLSGKIIMDGQPPFPFETEYVSFAPAATISATKMNVLYIGLPNPIEVSVSGVAPGNVSASMSGGNLASSGSGAYIATVSSPGTAKISASAKMPDGSTRSMGAVEFRIKRVPPPTVKFGSIPGGSASPGAISQQKSLVVYLQDFPYEGITYSVNSCEVSVAYRNKPPLTKRVNGSAIGALPAEPGGKVIISNIRVTGPGRNNELIPTSIVIDVTQ